jgi:hypothetical protein
MKTIRLTKGKCACVDDEDYESLSQYKWHTKKDDCRFYAARHPTRKITERMHRTILNAQYGEEVDHIDGDGLNNQKSNLRIVTHRQNMQNQHIKKTSKYPGVSKWSSVREKPWRANVLLGKKLIYLGSFKTEEEAHMKYIETLVMVGL